MTQNMGTAFMWIAIIVLLILWLREIKIASERARIVTLQNAQIGDLIKENVELKAKLPPSAIAPAPSNAQNP